MSKRFHHSKADKLIGSKRYELLQPNKVIEEFGVGEGDIVADLGAGNGFFTIPFAEKTKSTVYAVDIEPEMLHLLEKRAKERELSKIAYVVSDLEAVNLPDHSVDKAIISLVLHEVPNLDKAVQEAKRILKSGGQLLIVEWEKVTSESGPPLHHRISSSELSDVLKNHGFSVELTHKNEAIYQLICRFD